SLRTTRQSLLSLQAVQVQRMFSRTRCQTYTDASRILRHGCWRESALILQIRFELPYTLPYRRDASGICLLCADYSAATQKLQELLQRGIVPAVDLLLTRAMPQVLRRMLRTDLSGAESSSPKPLTESRRQHDATVYAMLRIPLLKRPYTKRPDVRRK